MLFQFAGLKSRFLVTGIWRTIWKTCAPQIHVPAGRHPRGAHCLFQCRYSGNILWGQITVMILRDFCVSAWLSCCLIHSSHATALACTLIFPKRRLQYYVCQIPFWISMISSIMSCINGLQSLGKQHKGVFCQIHWDSSPSMLHVFLLLLLLSGKTSPQYVKSSK